MINKTVVVTQDYHLYRAIYLAREMGIEAYYDKKLQGKDGYTEYERVGYSVFVSEITLAGAKIAVASEALS